jgi:L-threonylcarbamoyladenylate synthase
VSDLVSANTPGLIREAARLLAAGELIIFPTDTVYGIGAAASNEAAIRRLYAVKGRPTDKPLPLLIADSASASWIADVTPIAKSLASRFWPGPLTIVMRKHEDFRSLALAKQQTIGLRVPDNSVIRDIIHTLGEPITGTSANRSGSRSPSSAAEAAFQLGEMVAIVIDDGRLPGGKESTVIDITTTPPTVLREGPVSREEIQAVIGREVA